MYPNKIQEVIEDWRQIIFEDETELTDNINHQRNAVETIIGPILLDQWVNTGEAFIEEDAAPELLQKIIIYSHLLSMKDTGLVNSYKKEEDEEIFWLTDAGRKFFKN
ncbi:MAG: hypothetical protein RLZZ479_1258 [Bacteroidota bacterium]|jgi:hypothetical protein